MSWCGETICLGIRKEYMILNATKGTLSQVFSSGKIAPPLVVALPSGELILGKENIGVFVDQNGKLLQADRICWSEAPTIVIIQKPYAIALFLRRVETIVLHNARRLIKSNNAAVVALENSVYGLFPVPLGAQIPTCLADCPINSFSKFRGSILTLCKLLPPEDASLRAAKEGSIHIRYAHHLFDDGCYEETMEHFLASQVDITYVLSLYPSIVLPKLTAVPEPEKLMDLSPDASQLSRGSSALSDDLESLPPQLSESDENAALEFKKMSHKTFMGLSKFLQKKRYSIVEKAAAEGTEEVVLDAVGDNFTSTRFKKSNNKGRVNITINSAAREMAAILDTALLQALVLTGQSSAALELLKGLNYCDVKICEEILQKGNHYAVLLELYRSNSMHREALKLIHQLVEESKSNQLHAELIQNFSPEAILEYLKPLCGTDPMLVLEFSMLVLESCLTQTIELFFVWKYSSRLGQLLFEAACSKHAGQVQIYLSEVLEWYSELSAQQIWDEKAYSPTRKKLLSALESISGYNPEALLRRLPQDALFEEHAILVGKMNQHELALSLYVHKVGSAASIKAKGGCKKLALIEGAEDMRVSTSNTDCSGSDGDAEESSGEGLLSQRWDRINGAQPLKLLPRETRLQGFVFYLRNLLPFLGPLLKKSSEAYWNSSVIKNLRQSENLQVKDELYNQRKAVMKISSESMCSLCNKKIGTSVFAVYPNGKTLVDFVCFRDSQNMKALTKASPLRKR
ncbi:hypothetical protein DITRI_Ditri16bG0020800 [Diplodiscus trichospermus]